MGSDANIKSSNAKMRQCTTLLFSFAGLFLAAYSVANTSFLRNSDVPKASSSIQKILVESSAKAQQPIKPQIRANAEQGPDDADVVDISDAEFTSIRHIFQYGTPRTASTTQFNIVCVSLFLHIRAHSPELINNTICTAAGSFTNDEQSYKFMLQQDNIPQAVKSHVSDPDPRHIHNSTFVFATTNTKKDAERMELTLKKQYPNNTGIIQDLETLKALGVDYWLKTYAKFFRLSSDDVKLMSEYFQIWNELRQCCGMQMSTSFRNDILPSSQKNPNLKPHPLCKQSNAESLESSFMSTELYKIIAPYPLMRKMNRPAAVDGDLDGTYCKRYNDAVHEQGLPEDAEVNDPATWLNNRYQEIENHWGEELGNPFHAIEHLIQKKVS